MYYQLYLYYHLAQNNTSFYPSLFKAFREDPMTMWDANKSSLKFVRKVCEVAQEDLTDFFRFWGFFEPCTNLSVGGKTLTVKQSDIDATLNEISKYPKKNRGIIFIEDRVEKVPSTDYIMQAGNTRLKAGNPGQYGDLGQFTDYIAKNRTKSNYTFTQTDSKITMKGTGGVGFIVQDVSGKIIFASNSLNFSLPKNTGSLFKIYSVDADETLHECRKS